MAKFREVPVRALEVSAICEKCRVGVSMIYKGIMLTVDPPLYPHECPRCGVTENLEGIYPRIEHHPQ